MYLFFHSYYSQLHTLFAHGVGRDTQQKDTLFQTVMSVAVSTNNI